MIDGAAVRVTGGRIAAVGQLEAIRHEGDQILSYPDFTLWPGLIDLHIHGGGGQYFHEAGDLPALLRTLAGWGVTGVLPTVITSPLPEMKAAASRLHDLAHQSPPGARVLGIHLEGPFLNPKRKGAQPGDAILPPDPVALRELLAAGGGLVRLMALAPEMPGAQDLIKILRATGVRVAAGHTDATWEQMRAAVALGLQEVTHTGNAMTGLHHRVPGTLGAALALDELTCELIADGVHVHPAVLRLIWKAKGPERVALVSDAMDFAGLPDGEYELDGRKVQVSGRRATLADRTLAGSCSPLYVGVRTMVQEAGVPLAEAVRMASLTPAAALGLEGEIGSIEAGKAADLVLVDGSFTPCVTVIRGRRL